MKQKYIKKIKDSLRPVRGLGYAGDSRQQLRSRQVEILKSITKNQEFINRYPELLTCNENWVSLADKFDIANEIKRYVDASKTWANYPGAVSGLDRWVDSQGHQWPNLHPIHQYVIDQYNACKPKSVCEIGAGVGSVAKSIYAASQGTVQLTCVEGSEAYITSMRENFTKESKVILPQIDVKATIVKAIGQNLPFTDKSFEFVYTCTVMMHQPFIAGVLMACEMARVSSRYILHVEGYHTMGIVQGFRNPQNLFVPDYERLYRMLGFKTLKKIFFPYPYSSDFDGIVFLTERDGQ